MKARCRADPAAGRDRKAWKLPILDIYGHSGILAIALRTFVVRSGVLTSVHSFASDSRRGLFFFCIVGITVGAASRTARN